MNINTLSADIDAINNVRAYRQSIGATQRASYPYNWWQAALVVLTYMSEPTPTTVVSGILQDELGLKLAVSSTLLKNAVGGVKPDKIRREYNKSLPALAKSLGLAVGKTKVVGVRRPVSTFYLRNRDKARATLLAEHPHLMPLFVECDRIVRS